MLVPMRITNTEPGVSSLGIRTVNITFTAYLNKEKNRQKNPLFQIIHTISLEGQGLFQLKALLIAARTRKVNSKKGLIGRWVLGQVKLHRFQGRNYLRTVRLLKYPLREDQFPDLYQGLNGGKALNEKA